jgi:hypothetical protein
MLTKIVLRDGSKTPEISFKKDLTVRSHHGIVIYVKQTNYLLLH